MPGTSPVTARTGDKIRVLIVDDSASVRQALTDIINADPDLEVMATAPDPYVAAERIRAEVPDVIFLDIELPRMDGLTFLRKIMSQRPLPVVVCSSLAEEGSDTFMQALEAGAVDVVMKPRMDAAHYLLESRMRICDAAKAAAHARLRALRRPVPVLTVEPKLKADAIIPPLSAGRMATLRAMIPQTEPIVCIGASTGGTEALRSVLESLPATCPPVLIVQHMPEKFTGTFARRLDSLCPPAVKEAEQGDAVLRGRVLIAPGNRHMLLRRTARSYVVDIVEGPHISRHRPSVDVLFRSAAHNAGANAVGVILTGMGDDGAAGMLEMRAMGSFTIAQDEDSCIVYGMPKEAVDRGAVTKVMPLDGIAAEIMKQTRVATLEKAAR
ncbi:protein-glutamate methylesterase/protein-glutamine glutaminase [Aquibium microcysteis]|uniref:protein-glutamate methylesterase/protein-glutamine glutaminase n=1 Tax=Aquibium microcysteis TaxID=675281 RepID=UPI00165CFFC6|nr:chemotaxis response regulator protein-glutamate methylesterase [Aquibium microcysteis]